MGSRVLVLALGLLLVPGSAQAGFEFAEDGISVSNLPEAPKAEQKKVEWTPAKVEPEAGEGAQRPPSDPSAPALTTFNDRYVPDTVKKKYKISPEWYVRGADVPISSLIEGDKAQPVEPIDDGTMSTAAAASAPATGVPTELNVDRGYSAAASQPDVITISDRPPQPVAAPQAAAPVKASYVTVQTWRARKGEPVREVLKRWSEREGTEMMWAAAGNPVLPRDFSIVGSLQDAISGVLREAGQPLYTQYRSEGMTPVMMSPASSVTADVQTASAQQQPMSLVDAEPQAGEQIIRQDDYILKPPVPHAMPSSSKETRWFALSGAPLKEVLTVWAEDAGAELVWQAGRDFALGDSVSQVGTFEDAVYRALSQFDGAEVNRPVGQLYTDPASGQKVLVIKTEDAS